MYELPLSKFAPFTKEESKYQHQISNKLKELNINCINCIYLGEKVNENIVNNYKCNILSEPRNKVSENALCRFFTSKEEVEDIQAELSLDTDEELSIAIQKLDFINSVEVKQSIKNLREKLINE